MSIIKTNHKNTKEIPFYFNNLNSTLFGVIHCPILNKKRENFGFIICSAFAEERGFTQKLMVEWARHLCNMDYYVMRFDYRGYGDSEGLFESYNINNYLEDLGGAISEFKKKMDVNIVGFCGIRLGATIAALGANIFAPNACLILWEPIVNGDKYTDALLRWVIAKEMVNTGKAPRNRNQLKDQLLNGDDVVVEGHPINLSIYESLTNINLLDSDIKLKGPVQIIQFSKVPNQKPRRDLLDLQTLYSNMTDVKFEIITLPPLWTQTKEYIVNPAVLFEKSINWIQNSSFLSHSNASSPDISKNSNIVENNLDIMNISECNSYNCKNHLSVNNSIEKTVEFECEGYQLRGILHLPKCDFKDKPVIIFLSPGFNCRTARYRLYLRTAREIVKHGWAVLRFDYRGLGDSDGVLNFNYLYDLYNKIENGFFMPDVMSAIHFIKNELNLDKVILIGLCGGSVAAIHTVVQTQSVIGLIPVETPLLYTTNDKTAASIDDRPITHGQADTFLISYFNKIFSINAWKKFLTFKSEYRILIKSIISAISKRIYFKKDSIKNDQWFQDRLGPRTNLRLIHHLKTFLNRGIKTFFIFSSNHNAWNFDEIKAGLISNNKIALNNITQHTIKNADPGFSIPEHSREFIDITVNWLKNNAKSK